MSYHTATTVGIGQSPNSEQKPNFLSSPSYIPEKSTLFSIEEVVDVEKNTIPQSQKGPFLPTTTTVEVKEVLGSEQHPDQQPSISSSSPKPVTNSFSAWLIELLGLFAATGSLAAVVGILASLNHEKVTQLPFKIKLTTALSILSKVTEATITLIVATCLSQIMWMRYSSRHRPLNDVAVYDAATRGARGQALFLLHRGQSVKGYIGVALALLALTVGPFYQQTVGYKIVDGPASLARCFETNYTNAYNGMYNALHGGLFEDIGAVGTRRDQTLQTLNNDCSTGNCNWPTYASIGICGRCVNASDQIVQDCGMRQDRVKGTVYGCISSLNSRTFINNYTDFTMGMIVASMSPNTNGSTLGRLYGSSVSYDWSSIRYAKGQAIYAANCVLYYCVRGYNSTVTESALAENITTAWSDPNATKVFGAVIPDFSTGKPIGPENDTVLIPPQSEWGKMGLTQPTNFSIDWYTHKMLNQTFTDAFSGTHFLNYTNSSESSKYIGKDSQDIVVSQIYMNLWGSDPSQQNLSTVLNALSFEMTNALRNTCPRAKFINGTALKVAVILDVAWFWLVFPGSLIVLTGGFLVATMFESRRRQAVMWKTGILPLLFAGLNGDTANASDRSVADVPTVSGLVPPSLAAELENLEGMQKHAEGMHVRLQRNRAGAWYFAKPTQRDQMSGLSNNIIGVLPRPNE